MNEWRTWLSYDPIPALLGAQDAALSYFVRRDLLDEDAGRCRRGLGVSSRRRNCCAVQQADGAWDRPVAQKKHPAINYRLIETWRQLRILVDQYGFTRADPRTEQAAEFLFSCQTELGDLRGFLANQYANYYTGAILGLLVNAGYADDPRLEKGLQWLISNRQDDRGWSESLISNKLSRETIYRLSSEYAEPLEPDRTRPFSHTSTGMVLRGFAAHPTYRHCAAAVTAASLMKQRFFQPDPNSSYQAASYWVRFEYPLLVEQPGLGAGCHLTDRPAHRRAGAGCAGLAAGAPAAGWAVERYLRARQRPAARPHAIDAPVGQPGDLPGAEAAGKSHNCAGFRVKSKHPEASVN